MTTPQDEGPFYRLYRERERNRLQGIVVRELEEHRQTRPLCHASIAAAFACRCSCGGMYHGGRLPVFGDADDNQTATS